MRKLLALALWCILFTACVENVPEPQAKIYTVKVDYMGQGMSVPPSDTLTIVSIHRPRIILNNNISILVADDYCLPEASYVRSIKILQWK